jgi:hypothetical protein
MPLELVSLALYLHLNPFPQDAPKRLAYHPATLKRRPMDRSAMELAIPTRSRPTRMRDTVLVQTFSIGCQTLHCLRQRGGDFTLKRRLTMARTDVGTSKRIPH